MPYITCPDGKTHSRYDQSDYVKWCICDEKEQQQKKFNECMENPECKEEYLQKQEHGKYVSVACVVIFLFLLWLTLKVLTKQENPNP
jgi:hypothetical protein